MLLWVNSRRLKHPDYMVVTDYSVFSTHTRTCTHTHTHTRTHTHTHTRTNTYRQTDRQTDNRQVDRQVTHSADKVGFSLVGGLVGLRYLSWNSRGMLKGTATLNGPSSTPTVNRSASPSGDSTAFCNLRISRNQLDWNGLSSPEQTVMSMFVCWLLA